MNLRLVGTEPLPGINLQHKFLGTDSIPEPHCETCDNCGKPVLARNTYFNGTSFLCADCRQEQRLTETSTR